jgi:hypothetical protein
MITPRWPADDSSRAISERSWSITASTGDAPYGCAPFRPLRSTRQGRATAFTRYQRLRGPGRTALGTTIAKLRSAGYSGVTLGQREIGKRVALGVVVVLLIVALIEVVPGLVEV